MARAPTCIMAGLVLLISACTSSDDDQGAATEISAAATSTIAGDAGSTDTATPPADADSQEPPEQPETSTTVDPDQETIPPPPSLEPLGDFCEPAGGITRAIEFASGASEGVASNATVAGQSDLYGVEVADGQIMSITLTSPGSDTVATILSPNGVFTPGAFVRSNVAPTEAGVYWICVIAGDTSDNYQLAVSVIDDNTPTTVDAAWCGTNVNDRGEIRFAAGANFGRVEDAVIGGERDLYTLGAGEGQRLTGSVSSLEGNAAVIVRSPSGVVMEEATIEDPTGEDDLDAIAAFGLLLPETGDYQLCIAATRGNATYAIEITIN